ncbi:MAG TPA: CpaD family pilus assembly lipoprotein [Sphingomonas sp.]|nr:CpaD family pilus assembly lipoprotein [Sphingomonas sp.]
MTKRLLLLAAACPSILIGGCMGTQNKGLESVHQPVVARQDSAIDVALRGNALAPGEGQRLTGWFDSMRLAYGDRIAVDDGGAPAAAAAREVAAIVASKGILLSSDAPVTEMPLTPGTLRVVVSRLQASVPGCPDHSRDTAHEFGGNTSSNYGCAVNVNLAAMVASPGDLVQGRSSGNGNDPRVNYRAIDAYRKATPTGGGGTTVKAESAKGN